MANFKASKARKAASDQLNTPHFKQIRLGKSSITSYEATVVPCEAEKPTDNVHVFRFRPIPDGLQLNWVGRDPLLRYYMPQVLKLGLPKHTFLPIRKQFFRAQNLHHCGQMNLVLLPSAAVDEDIGYREFD